MLRELQTNKLNLYTLILNMADYVDHIEYIQKFLLYMHYNKQKFLLIY